MGQISYATREDVLSSLDMAETTRAGAQIDRLLAAASRAVEALCRRRWYPEVATRFFPWPDAQMGTSYRLWLDANPLLSVESVSSGGTAVTDYFLEPQQYGPPYSRIEIDRSGSAAFGGGDTAQRSISITGVWGSCQDSRPVAELAASLSSSAVTLTVTDSSAIGIGSLIKVEDEYLTVVGRGLLDTGQTLVAALVERNNDVSLIVGDATDFTPGEILRVGGERLRITDTDGVTLLYVERAVDSTPLMAHDIAAPVLVSRRYTVTRGALGTTAAAHGQGVTVELHTPPADVASLVVEDAVWNYQNEQSGMGRTIGSGPGAIKVTADTLSDRREQVRAAHGRMRKRAV